MTGAGHGGAILAAMSVMCRSLLKPVQITNFSHLDHQFIYSAAWLQVDAIHTRMIQIEQIILRSYRMKHVTNSSLKIHLQ